MTGSRHAREALAESLVIHLRERNHERGNLALPRLVEPAVIRRINTGRRIGIAARVIDQVAVHRLAAAIVTDDVDIEAARNGFYRAGPFGKEYPVRIIR